MNVLLTFGRWGLLTGSSLRCPYLPVSESKLQERYTNGRSFSQNVLTSVRTVMNTAIRTPQLGKAERLPE